MGRAGLHGLVPARGREPSVGTANILDAVTALRAFRERRLFNPVCHSPGAEPYHRPTRADWPLSVFQKAPLNRAELATMDALEAHRTLFNIYEQELLFLPRHAGRAVLDDMWEFYDESLLRLGEIVRPDLERYCFAFLDETIDVGFDWDGDRMFQHFDATVRKHEASKSSLLESVEASPDPRKSWRDLIVQSAGDFLTEASAMARLLPGNYGPLQSAIFRVFIDEYGYGVHSSKHSTLFETLMEEVGLDSRPHRYFGLYLTSSLVVHNYIHWICRCKPLFFRYLGAAYYAEATYVHTCEEMAASLGRVFCDRVDSTYFLEHGHIDRHHRRMLRNELVMPAIALYGHSIVPEIIRGFEEFRWLVGWWSEDVCRQLEAIEVVGECRVELMRPSDGAVPEAEILCADASADVALSISNDSLYYWCEEGESYLRLGVDDSRRLSSTEAAVVSGGRPHALVARGKPSAVIRCGEFQSG